MIKAVDHPIRRQFLRILQRDKRTTYSRILRELELTTGKLNFHLKTLTGLYEKAVDNSYSLTNDGKLAVSLLDRIDKHMLSPEGEEYTSELRRRSLEIQTFTPDARLLIKYVAYILLVMMTTAVAVLLLPLFRDDVDYSTVLLSLMALAILFVFCLWLSRAYVSSILYVVYDTEIVIIKGILVKTRKVLPFRSVTNMASKHDFLDRRLGMGSLAIQTAGKSGPGAEASLVGLAEPERLMDLILDSIREFDMPRVTADSGLPAHEGLDTELLQTILSELRRIRQV